MTILPSPLKWGLAVNCDISVHFYSNILVFIEKNNRKMMMMMIWAQHLCFALIGLASNMLKLISSYQKLLRLIRGCAVVDSGFKQSGTAPWLSA